MSNAAPLPSLSSIPPRAAEASDRAAAGVTHWSPAAAVLATAILSLGVYALQRPAFEELLGLSRVALHGEEPWLLPTSVLAASLVAYAPAALVAFTFGRLGKPGASRRTFIALSAVATFLLLLDLDLMRSVGRHLIEVAAFAVRPHGHVAGGDVSRWVPTIALWILVSAVSSWAAAWAAGHGLRITTRGLTPILRRSLGATGAFLLLLVIAAPQALETGWRNQALHERLYGTLLFDARIGHAVGDAQAAEDPTLAAVAPRWRESYRAAYPAMMAGKPADRQTIALPPRPPNVVMIVTESFRHDAFTPELMPRLSRWASGGFVSPEHDSGTIYSESGMFALLYGRSPAVFHQTLDAHVPPQLCVTLRQAGYDCAYFSGHPKVWQRREEYLNEQTMDHFVHDDHGTWPEWDQHALDGMVKMVNESKKPVFAIVLLMSSHFEYQYPPRYEVDRPVSGSAWHVTSVRTLGPGDELPHRNRYRNCMRFIDDAVAGAIDQLDPAHNLVVFTGDHGESINDDGRYTHGYSFAEVVTRTPFAMVGPGISPEVTPRPTYHVDVLPSLLHALSGRPQQLAHTHGIDWFSTETRDAALEAHSPPGQFVIETQLRAAGLRFRMNLDARSPSLELLGFEDQLGHLAPTPVLGEREIAALTTGFESELSRLRN